MDDTVKKKIKRCIQKGAASTGAYYITKKLKKGAVLLFYHGVEKNIINPVVQESHVPLAEFEKQLRYLNNNFEVISIDYLHDCISHGYKIDPSQVVLTFDDGYRNNLYNVVPLLRVFNMPCAVFISTRYINNNDDLRLPYYYVRTAIYYTEQRNICISSIQKEYDISTKERRASVINEVLHIIKKVPQRVVSQIVEDVIQLLPADRWLELNALFASDELMNWDEVHTLHNSGVTIGSHCHDHVILHSDQSDAETDYQLSKSKTLIENHIGECKYLSYPNGRMQDISHYSIRRLKTYRFHLGLTTVPGEVEHRVNPFIMPRLYPHKDIEGFKFVLNTSFRHNDCYYKWCSTFYVPECTIDV